MARAPSDHAGILLVDKPCGPTSHDVVGWVRWALDERAVGHCGTLDPAASGLLVICVGAATKLVEALTGVDKRYRARFVLGRATTTADAEGETIAEASVDDGDLTRAEAILEALRGPLELPPPAYSAVKLAGKRAHALARAGETPELPPRPMAVHALTIEGRGREGARAWIDADLTVAKGTYIRSLAEEIGRRLGLPVHLGALRRLACGELCVDDPRAVVGLIARRLPDLPEKPGRSGKSGKSGKGKGLPRPPRWRIAPADEVDAPADKADAPADAGTEQAEQGRGAESGPDPAVAARRAHARQLLLDRLDPPWVRLPCPVTVLAGEAHARVFERLLQGQRLDLDQARRLTGLSAIDGDAGLRVLVDPARGRMILVEAIGEGDDWRLAPTRVIRLPATPGEATDT